DGGPAIGGGGHRVALLLYPALGVSGRVQMNRRQFTRSIAAGTVATAAAAGLPRAAHAAHAALFRRTPYAVRAAAQAPSPLVDGARLNRHLALLAEYGRNPEGGVTRLAYSD